MGNLFPRHLLEYAAEVMVGLDDHATTGPLVLCRASGTCREWLAIAEEVAQRQCKDLGRRRLSQLKSWRRVLGHLCPEPRLELELTCSQYLPTSFGPPMWIAGHKGTVQCVAQLADGRIVTGSTDASLRVWDSESGDCTLELTGHTNGVFCVAQLADGRIVSGSTDKSLRVWS